MDVEGPGVIQHIWFAVAKRPDVKRYGRWCVLQFY